MIRLKPRGSGLSAKPPTEAIETWGKKRKKPLSLLPLPYYTEFFMMIRVQNKTTPKKMAFSICFYLSCADWSGSTKRKAGVRSVGLPRGAREDAAGLHSQPHHRGRVTLLPLTSLLTWTIKDACPAFGGGKIGVSCWGVGGSVCLCLFKFVFQLKGKFSGLRGLCFCRLALAGSVILFFLLWHWDFSQLFASDL